MKLPANVTLVIPRADATGTGSDADAVEMTIRGPIGTTYDWRTDQVQDTEADLTNALASVPRGRKINVRINSPGGNLVQALGIHNALAARRADVTTYNEGLAASSAAVIMMAGGRVVMPGAAVFMIHCAANDATGNAEAMRKNAEMLDKFDQAIAKIMADKSGKKAEQILDLMRAETWMTGDEARAARFADEDLDTAPTYNLTPANRVILNQYRNLPANLAKRLAAAPQNQAPVPPVPHTPTMKLTITALAALGITLAAETDDAIAGAVTNLGREVTTERAARRERITNRVQAAIDAKRIKPERKDALIALGLQNETNLDLLDEIAAPPAAAAAPAVGTRAPRGTAPVPPDTAPQAGEDLESVRAQLATERDPAKAAALARRARQLRGHANLFPAATPSATPAQN